MSKLKQVVEEMGGYGVGLHREHPDHLLVVAEWVELKPLADDFGLDCTPVGEGLWNVRMRRGQKG